MKYSIGTTYEGKDFAYLQTILPYVQHIEVSPDSIAIMQNGRARINPEALAQLQWLQQETNVSLLLHGVGLSIGSYDGYSTQYTALLDELFGALKEVRWHSEHLAYTKVGGENLGTMLALPRTNEAIDLLCNRIDTIQEKYKRPFLIENVISMLPPAACDYSEAAFLNAITARTGCGLVLDVYNLECDEANFGLDINAFLDELNMERVYELHLAGGSTDPEFDFKMDIHSQRIDDTTLRLAQQILASGRTRVAAITYEILEEFIGNHGPSVITRELLKLHQTFNQYEPRAVAN